MKREELIMEFQHENGRYFLEKNGKVIAQITYAVINEGQTYSINSTVVDPSLRGQGVAKKLLDTIVADARAKNMTIKPVCPYVKEAFLRYPDTYQEIEYKS
ncbi:GNAT family N-acetyltransferase [Leuconostoc mesenteroides]|uniref:GNAT family N-acetyltransferase n=1 Tax=Leuconostoc mesenteroides TaxID=1245 RepID=UPI0023609828|nr:GNAT family N-acetyltransferase [Leuconostoc mesenteroides]